MNRELDFLPYKGILNDLGRFVLSTECFYLLNVLCLTITYILMNIIFLVNIINLSVE